MTTRKDAAAQGVIPDPVRLKGRKISGPNGKAIIAGIGRAVKATDAAETKPRPAQRLRDLQDWKRG